MATAKKKKSPFPKKPKISLGKITSLKALEAAEKKIDDFRKKKSEISKKLNKSEQDRKKLIDGRKRLEKALSGL